MIYRTPGYCRDFRCIAGDCRDSCCKGWEIDIDDEAAARYAAAAGEFGERLRRNIENGSFVLTEDERCPFLNDRGLCDIYINLGEEHLCETCGKFPRITMDYTSFTEYTLSLACPEAARLILGGNFIIPEKNYDLNDVDYNAEDMKTLLTKRQKAYGIITDKSISFKERLGKLFEYFGGDIPDKETVFAIHERMDFINKEYSDEIKNASSFPQSEDFDEVYTRMAVYYLYRYFLNAIDDMDLLSAVKKIYFAYVITASIAGSIDNPDIVRIIQNYSKEVEHSYDNSETLELFF